MTISTGNPNPIYSPGYAAAATQQPYGVSAQTTDSQVVSPVIVFQVNLETQNRQGHLVPNRTTVDGNEIAAEADLMKNTRTMYIPALVQDSDGNDAGAVAVMGVGGMIGNNGINQGYLHHGQQFTVKGAKATYLKKQYVSTPPSPSDLLIVISQS